MSMSSHQSARSKSCDWLTPPGFIAVLGPFDLDPCASVNQPWRTAKEQWTERGLDRPWHGMVWLNPPYGPPKVIEPWMERMAAHDDGIACIPARTETACWFKYVWNRCFGIMFLKGRPHFHSPVTGVMAKNNSGVPIVLIAYGERSYDRLLRANMTPQPTNPWLEGHVIQLVEIVQCGAA